MTERAVVLVILGLSVAASLLILLAWWWATPE
jgi:hypothetical protein